MTNLHATDIDLILEKLSLNDENFKLTTTVAEVVGNGWHSLRVAEPTIPALERWIGEHAMTKDATTAAAVAADILLSMIGATRSRTGSRPRARLHRDDAGEELRGLSRRAMGGASPATIMRRRRSLAAGMAIASGR